MKRRRYITALGGITGISSFVVGSGAFNFANVERTVSVAIADDYTAFLRLTQRGSGDRSDIDGNPDVIKFSIPGDDEDDYPTGSPTKPEGVGTDSVYRFGEDAGHDETGLFGVENQGNQPVKIYSTQPSTSGVPSVTIFDVESSNLLTEDSPSSTVDVGEQLVCGLEIDTHGVDVQNDEYDLSVVINAEVP